ncbi:GGDEF domain-containing protein [Vibrio hepatarius]|nr:GGDEF domain-containing protein [Vibrio hepatarius]NVJ56869.1 GGDEF domain-containing protein [Vibrionaceae bacterium]
MNNHTRNANLPSILVRSKALLVTMSLLLILANIYALASTRNLAKTATDQQSQATWFLFQLTKEFSELNALAPFAAESSSRRDQVLLKYDLTWSRFDVLLNNKETDSFMSLPSARGFFQSLFRSFKELEPELALIKQPQYADKLAGELSYIYMSMIDYINLNFRLESPIYLGYVEHAQVLYRIQIGLLMLLCICASLTGYIIHKEAQYHRELSLTDSLTKVGNRLALFNDLEFLIEGKQAFTLFLLDLNGFKQINDRFGHQSGDRALKQIAGRISVLGMDCYRVGGDEFALISLHNEDIEVQWAIIESCFYETVDVGKQQHERLSTSIGVAQFPKDANQSNQLISIADGKMYRMKFSQNEQGLIG